LYIVKEALSKIAGDITVSSIYGEGTTFRIIIPNLAKKKESNTAN
jgi:chemotaxis protein histidine kinase CheA